MTAKLYFLKIHSINIQSEGDRMSGARGVQKCSDAGPTVTIQQPKSSLGEPLAVFILIKKTLCSNRIYIIAALIVPSLGKVRNPPPSRRTVVKATKARVQRERVSGLEK